MRRYLEDEMSARSLRGRLQYCCTTYPGMDGCRLFEIYVDGRLAKRCSWETVNTYFIQNGYKDNNHPFGHAEYWSGFFPLLDRIPADARPEHTDEEFCAALAAYRNQSIRDSLRSDDPLVRMLAVLDRRTGKRTLLQLKESVPSQPMWLQYFYRLRLDAEHI